MVSPVAVWKYNPNSHLNNFRLLDKHINWSNSASVCLILSSGNMHDVIRVPHHRALISGVELTKIVIPSCGMMFSEFMERRNKLRERPSLWHGSVNCSLHSSVLPGIRFSTSVQTDLRAEYGESYSPNLASRFDRTLRNATLATVEPRCFSAFLSVIYERKANTCTISYI